MGNGFVDSNTRIHIATGVMAVIVLYLALALGTPSFAFLSPVSIFKANHISLRKMIFFIQRNCVEGPLEARYFS